MTSNMSISSFESTIGQFGEAWAEEPMPKLRWHNGILQQYWKKTKWERCMVSDESYEWRNVPVENN